jgi:hypothetical protein
MYPHLIDLIFSHADAHDLVRLRAACRAWRERADVALSTHIVIGDEVRAVGLPGDLVGYPPFAPHTHHDDRWTNTPKVIDLLGTFQVRHLNGMRRLPFLRLWDGVSRYGLLAPTTVIIFTWTSPIHHRLDSIDRNKSRYLDPLHSKTRKIVINLSLATEPCKPLHSKTRKIVINLSLATEPCKPETTLMPFSFNPTGVEIVIIITTPTPREDGSLSLSHKDAGLWDRLVELLRIALRDRWQCTFVNTTAVPRELLPDLLRRPDFYQVDYWRRCYPQTWAAFKTAERFQEAAAVYVDEVLTLHSSLRRQPRVEFLSSAEYEAKVGTETYRIETMEQPWRV